MSKPTFNDFSTVFSPEAAGVVIEGTSLTATVTTDPFGTDRFSGCEVYIEIGAVTGTSPTLDLKLQKLIPTGADTDPFATSQAIDLAAGTQATATVKLFFSFISSGNLNLADATAAVSAASSRTTSLGQKCVLKLTIAGTSPVFPITKFRVTLIR